MAELVTFPCRAITNPGCYEGQNRGVGLSGGLASAACAVMLNDRSMNGKAVGLALIVIVGVTFFDFVTPLADEKLGQIALMRMVARNKGVQCLHAMDQSVTREKIERSIDGRRFGTANIRAQAIKQVIGFHGPAIAKDKF